jgi:transcriptional regulator GlxA family with amidase domain
MRHVSPLLAVLLFAAPVIAQAPAQPVAPAPSEAAAKTVLVLIYDGVELGDLAAPVSVFKVANELGPTTAEAFDIQLAAEKSGLIQADCGFFIQADCVLSECPPADILILAGGRGALEALNRPALIDWIRRQSTSAETVLSVCLGTFLMAKAGLLVDVPVTIHAQGAGYLQHLEKRVKLAGTAGYLEAGKIISSAGVSSSIDASLVVVARHLGAQRAKITSEWLDDDWRPVTP